MTSEDATQEPFSQQTVTALDRLVATGAALELPAPPEVLLQLRNKLGEDSYRVLVLGEAKRGKSTFVNAMLGAEILPTDVDVATSQVFLVRAAQDEAYWLRFEDGSTREIQRGDLGRYGSQVVADQGEGAHLEQGLLWIEVAVPAQSMPQRLAILDTPGLGALYAAHAQVTRRLLPQADAVLLILDSAQPIGEREVELLEAVLAVTQRVFFVQTKIDQHDRAVWEETRKRNEEILAERFPGRLTDARVWPVSSSNLLSASQAEDGEPLLFVSRYRELAEALQGFLEDVCAAPRAAETLLLAARYHRSGEQVLEARLQSLTQLSQSEAAAYREAVAERSRNFEAEWGERGRERIELQQAIRRTTSLSKQGFREAVGSGGAIALAQQARIQTVSSVAEANQLGELLGPDTVNAMMDEWTRVCELANQRYAAALAPFMEATEDALGPIEVADSGPTVDILSSLETKDAAYDRLRSSYGQLMPIVTVGGLLTVVLASPVMIPLAMGGAALWALARGWREAQAKQTKSAKAELDRYARSVVHQVSQHYFSVDLAGGRFSRVDEYFAQVEGVINDQVGAVVKQRVTETRQELARLQAEAQLQADDRQDAVQRTQTGLAQWVQIGQVISELLAQDRSRAHLTDLTQQGTHPAVSAIRASAPVPSRGHSVP